MIKILWFSSCAPSRKAKTAGGQTFQYYFNEMLRDDRFEIRLVCLGDAKRKDELEKELKGVDTKFIYPSDSFFSKFKKIQNLESMFNPWNKHAGLMSNYCSSVMMDTAKKYKTDGYIPDIIILEWTSTVVHAKQLHKIFPNSKIVASEHDVTFLGYGRKKEYYKGLKHIFWKLKFDNEKRIELSALKECELILPHNAENKDILISEGLEKSKIMSLTPYYNNMASCERKSNQRDILYFGAMSRMENSLSAMWFIDNVMPLLSDLDIRFVVLGSNPPEKLKAKENSKVHITGFVDSVEPYFQESICLVAPLVLGAGIKVKVLEAMSSGIPVLTNNIGIEGIPAENGEEYYHCVTPQEYADIIRKLYSGQLNVKNIEKNAKAFIKENFSIEHSLCAYKDKLVSIGEKI